jgi:protein tyrosine kinase modulator
VPSVKQYTLDEIVWIVVRRRWLILVPFAVGVAIAPFISRLMPERYRSETLILVVPQRVPDSYVRSTVSETVGDRLPSISDQILSRSRLERIINDLDLFQPEQPRQLMEDVVGRMRADISVSLDARSTNSFRISYVSDDPATARKVTERLASLYIEQNLRDRENQAEGTSQFIETQLEDAKKRLLEHEKKLEDYRRRYAGQLPTQLQGNLQAIQNAHLRLQTVSESMNRALERRLMIAGQIADAEAFPSPPQPPNAPAASDGVLRTSTAQQLEAAQARLDTAIQRYTPDHPEVLSLQRTIADLQVRLEGEHPVGPSQVVQPSLLHSEGFQQKRVRELRAELTVIDHQLTANRAEEALLNQTIAEYQAKVDVVPTRESELVELTRDYSTLQAGYASLLMKHEDSKIAANLERRQIGEQFRVVDPASLPEKPYNQLQRLGAMASGPFAGLVLGVLLVGFLEYRDSSFRGEEDVLRVLSVPVLAMVPFMASDREERRERRRSLAVDVAGVALLLGAVAVLALWRLQP